MKSRLTTQEMRNRAGQHRHMADFKPAYPNDPRGETKNAMMREAQTVMAEVYEELIERREQDHENS